MHDPVPKSIDEQNSPLPKHVINEARRSVRLHKFLGNHLHIVNGMSFLEQVAHIYIVMFSLTCLCLFLRMPEHINHSPL